MAVQGAIPLSHDAAFPSGAFVVGAVEPVADFDAAAPVGGGQRPQKLDKVTGLPMWSVPVIDGDETARAAQKSVKVNVVARVQPVPPDALAGLPFRPVEFENLTVTPYVSDSNGSRPRVAYSFRATGMHAPGGKAAGKGAAA